MGSFESSSRPNSRSHSMAIQDMNYVDSKIGLHKAKLRADAKNILTTAPNPTVSASISPLLPSPVRNLQLDLIRETLGRRPRFYSLAKEVSQQGAKYSTPQEYLTDMNSKSKKFMFDKSVLLKRHGVLDAMTVSILEMAGITVFLGSRNSSKTMVKERSIEVATRQVKKMKKGQMMHYKSLDVWSVDLRSSIGHSLHGSLYYAAKNKSGAPGDLSAGSVYLYLDKMVARNCRKNIHTAIVIDHCGELVKCGEDRAKEISDFVAKLIHWSKEGISVSLISSDLVLPYRLQDLGLPVASLTVVLLGDMSQTDMMNFMLNTWGIDNKLAEEFYAYYGGDVFTACKALLKLSTELKKFEPMNVIDVGRLTECVTSPEAFEHLVNIANLGYSMVRGMSDKGAKEIVEAEVAALIHHGTCFTGSCPNIQWQSGMEYALVPVNYYMRLKIAHVTLNVPRSIMKDS